MLIKVSKLVKEIKLHNDNHAIAMISVCIQRFRGIHLVPQGTPWV